MCQKLILPTRFRGSWNGPRTTSSSSAGARPDCARRSRGPRRTPTSRSPSCRKSTRCGATRCPPREGPRRSSGTTIRWSCTRSTRSRGPTSSPTRTPSRSSLRRDRREGDDPRDGRLRPGVRIHNKRLHQDRRRHGPRLPCRRAPQGYGDGAVPSDVPAGDGHPDHRGGSRGGRLPDQQGRRAVHAALPPEQDGTRTAGHPLPLDDPGDEGGPCVRRSVRAVPRPGPPSPRRRDDRPEAPDGPRARGEASREALRKEEARVFDGLMGRERGKETLAGVRVEMQQLMERDVGIFRDEAGLADACGKLAKLRDRFGSVGMADKDRVFNTEMTGVLELDFMLDVAASIAHSALNRRESRGAHSRTDFPNRDDANYLKHTLAYRADGAPRIDYVPVKITKWQPVERKY